MLTYKEPVLRLQMVCSSSNGRKRTVLMDNDDKTVFYYAQRCAVDADSTRRIWEQVFTIVYEQVCALLFNVYASTCMYVHRLMTSMWVVCNDVRPVPKFTTLFLLVMWRLSTNQMTMVTF
jgi:hypothetical protein